VRGRHSLLSAKTVSSTFSRPPKRLGRGLANCIEYSERGSGGCARGGGRRSEGWEGDNLCVPPTDVQHGGGGGRERKGEEGEGKNLCIPPTDVQHDRIGCPRHRASHFNVPHAVVHRQDGEAPHLGQHAGHHRTGHEGSTHARSLQMGKAGFSVLGFRDMG